MFASVAGFVLTALPLRVMDASLSWLSPPLRIVLMLVGAVVMLPVILAYTMYVYSLFWGKVDPEESYHD